jgi:hypothetical protein
LLADYVALIEETLNKPPHQQQQIIEQFGKSTRATPRSIFRSVASETPLIPKTESLLRGIKLKTPKKVEEIEELSSIKLGTPSKVSTETPVKKALRDELFNQTYQTNLLKFEKAITVDKLKEFNDLFGINKNKYVFATKAKLIKNLETNPANGQFFVNFIMNHRNNFDTAIRNFKKEFRKQPVIIWAGELEEEGEEIEEAEEEESPILAFLSPKEKKCINKQRKSFK